MSELCSAFKRIVPRYQFATNQAAFTIEDLKDAPIKKRNGGDCFKGPMCGHNRGFHVGENAHYSSAYGFNYRPKVCQSCDVKCQKRMAPGCGYCSSMDTCGNFQSKVSYYHDM